LSYHRIYKYTSIGRPLEPQYPSNKAVILLLPVAALAGAVISWISGDSGMQVFQSAIWSLLIAFGSWALARELAPDDNPVAFLAMGFAFLVSLGVDSPGVLSLFATLGLVRIVNRSTGLTARISDSIVVMLLTYWVIYSTGSPFFGLVAAVAYVLDGSLKDPFRNQWVFAIICFAGMVIYMVDHDVGLSVISAPDALGEWLALMFLLVFALNAYLLGDVTSTGDVGGEKLDTGRVKGGMIVALLVVLQGLNNIESVVLVAATIAALTVSVAFRRAFRSPMIS
jgi:hypothetical protein